MRISQKLEYACRALAQLSKRHDGRTITRLDELAQREAISANFLVQILNDLRRSGIIDSKRGKAGGYLLSRPPTEITLRQIVESVDPSLLHSTISTDGESGSSVRDAWDSVFEEIRQRLDSITLAQFGSHSGDPMFYI